MKNKTKMILSIVGVVVIAFVAVLIIPSLSSEKHEGEAKEISVKSKKGGKGAKRVGKTRRERVKSKTAKTVSTEQRKSTAKTTTYVLQSIDDDELSKLSKEQKKLLQDIQNALDNDDRKSIIRLVQELQLSTDWPDNIPSSIKIAAVDALGWFGASCLPEIAGFLADSNEEVRESAIEKYDESLSDTDLNDIDRSSILVMASRVVTDSDAMDSMMFALNDMRNSVAVDTIKQLMEVGNEATRSVLQENIDFFTGEEGLDTPEKLEKWLAENPDDEDDK